jgi:hypothetical protein
MREQTIYSYKLLHRFRWRFAGFFLQVSSLLALLYTAAVLFAMPFPDLLVSLSILATLPVLHFLLFRTYAYCRSQTAKISPDMLFSPWWGAGTAYPSPLAFFRGAELTVCAGSLLVPAALYVWLPPSYGIALAVGAIAFAVPRIAALLVSLRQPKHCRVKYEIGSVAFLLTDG